MDNVFPAFRAPAATKPLPAAVIIEKDRMKNPLKEKDRQIKEAAARLSTMKYRPPDKDVFLNGWPLNPPHLRHTVLYDSTYPERASGSDVDAASAVLAIEDARPASSSSATFGHDAARSVSMLARMRLELCRKYHGFCAELFRSAKSCCFASTNGLGRVTVDFGGFTICFRQLAHAVA